MTTSKINKVVYVSNLFSNSIWLFVLQLIVTSLKSVVLNDFLMKCQRINLYSDAHSHTVYFIMMV